MKQLELQSAGPLEFETELIIRVQRVMGTSLDNIMKMPAVRYDAYVEIIGEMIRKEQLKANEENLRRMWHK